ncbi:MAG: thioredoxin family protein [Niabella sp.]|nr:thioredoxin family protein [Niabella sp.]
MNKPVLLLLLIISVFLQTNVSAQEQGAPLSAATVLKQGFAEAKKDNKKLLLIFHASWCGWCHKMDTSLNDPSCKAAFEKNYVIKHLTVLESAANKRLENPGADSVYALYKNEHSGIPLWVVYDSAGKLLATSMLPDGNNTGCPASKPEVDYFISVLRKTSRMNEGELKAAAARFRRNEAVVH